MPSTRFYGTVSTALLVVGALAVGQALHLTVVTGEVSYTSPAFVILSLLGLVLIVLGYRARRPVAEAWDLTSDEGDGGTDGSGGGSSGESSTASVTDEAEFDPSMSPLGEAAPGDAERDRERDGTGDGSGSTADRRGDGLEGDR
ncbi:hypothetical protein [Halorarum halobium]|uniref:hypothetical protein n=1 Tax=Halorarum halobium TaxID=3075121 RepID=UPI0028B1A010|nr:hypothetical protein [Halobaculum sp. XH14]